MIKHIEAIESVQRRATKLEPKIKNLTYPDRLHASFKSSHTFIQKIKGGYH